MWRQSLLFLVFCVILPGCVAPSGAECIGRHVRFCGRGQYPGEGSRADPEFRAAGLATGTGRRAGAGFPTCCWRKATKSSSPAKRTWCMFPAKCLSLPPSWQKGLSLKGYLSGAGGLSDRADAGNLLIVGLNGEVSRARGQAIEPGDRILVMPKFDSKNLQLVKDVTQVLYQMAVAVKVAVGL